MILAALMMLAQVAAAPAGAAADTEMTIPGPHGALAGSLRMPAAGAPAAAAVILPGSGPTDRNGDNPMGVAGGTYRQLAEQLAAQGIATVRIDKRGLFGSRAAIADPNAVTIADYAGDARAWAAALRRRLHLPCVWLIGHSEGGLVALAAAEQPTGICGLVLIAAPGRPLGTALREQLNANPANAPILPAALQTIAALEGGRRVDIATLPAPLQRLFNPAIQGYWIDILHYRPAELAAHYRGPLAIVQGRCDIQVSVADATALKTARPDATLTLVDGVNHALRPVASCDRAGSMASYADPAAAISPAVVSAVAGAIAGPARRR